MVELYKDLVTPHRILMGHFCTKENVEHILDALKVLIYIVITSAIAKLLQEEFQGTGCRV